MDFGKILSQWENRNAEKKNQDKSIKEKFQKYLDSAEIIDKDKNIELKETEHISSKKLKIDETLDLHGLKQEEAANKLNQFINESVQKGCKKVLIIHGKGIHSNGEAVLRTLVKNFIKDNNHCGASGHPGRELGGTGATWIVLK